MANKDRKTSVLTVREKEIVRLTILGYTNKQISKKLIISTKMVENHKAKVIQKSYKSIQKHTKAYKSIQKLNWKISLN
ncbi:response regulator transcription factor [Metabacillus rhizosphaerae]|uniref:response regulator transcription factor n=1 Tax=Metabacillus rhizosphaerae TaxID=3117747 RepID=UPI0039B76DB2